MSIKNVFLNIFSKLGLYVVPKIKHNGASRFIIENLGYDAIFPSANYAPWTIDKEFMSIYQTIQKNTLVDKYRCYELWELAKQAHFLDEKASFLEVGVWRGGTASLIGKKLALLNSNAQFYLADTFAGVANASSMDTFYNGGEHADSNKMDVLELTKSYYPDIKILEGIFPDQTGNLIDSSVTFSFCHIDVDVYDSAKNIVDWIWDRLIIGGIIVFDDYGFHWTTGVTKYVNSLKNLQDRIIIHNINGHAVMIKVS